MGNTTNNHCIMCCRENDDHGLRFGSTILGYHGIYSQHQSGYLLRGCGKCPVYRWFMMTYTLKMVMFYCYNEDTEGKQWRLTGKKWQSWVIFPSLLILTVNQQYSWRVLASITMCWNVDGWYITNKRKGFTSNTLRVLGRYNHKSFP